MKTENTETQVECTECGAAVADPEHAEHGPFGVICGGECPGVALGREGPESSEPKESGEVRCFPVYAKLWPIEEAKKVVPNVQRMEETFYGVGGAPEAVSGEELRRRAKLATLIEPLLKPK